MHASRYTATIDACVLAGALPRNMILSLAEAGLFRPRWSAHILDETERAIAGILMARGDSAATENAIRHRSAIERAFPESQVDDYEGLIPALTLPHPNDRHVLAAAIQTRASVIVTDNLKDFPPEFLKPFGLQASSADEFLADMIDLYTPNAVAAIRTMRDRFRRPEISAEALVQRMELAGLNLTANLLVREIESL